MSRRALVVRLDSAGDVLLAGPAVRAVAAGADHVTLLVGPRGEQAARLLPGVDEVVVWPCPWIDATPPPARRADVDAIVDRLARGRYQDALILTSFHQSPLPTALLLRLAGVRRIAAVSEDYPGTLLDVRHRLDETERHSGPLHEVRRALSTAAALGYPLPVGDDGRLAVRWPLPDPAPLLGAAIARAVGRYVVLHPGASVPARAWPARRFAVLAGALAEGGRPVVVTGGPGEARLTAAVSVTGRVRANAPVRDLGGRTDLAALAGVLAGAAVVVSGNTGPAHLAAAVGVPVVSLFAPTVPAERWAPYTDRLALLGNQAIECAGCRARGCPVPGHPCLDPVSPAAVLAAIDRVTADPAAPGGGAVPPAAAGATAMAAAAGVAARPSGAPAARWSSARGSAT
ncbi:MAG: glycosyltransferase family 9 protein [Frankia sp.]|nr:glycosyltransferase family 9 protein [Frankia sp.]